MYTNIIQSFQTSYELDNFIASLLLREFAKAGLILLPTGTTFSKRIYPLVNDYLEDINPELQVSHLDDLMNGQFARELKENLPKLISKLGDKFFAMDFFNPSTFDDFVKSNSGPRLILMGLGLDPEIAHIAFIGEEYINSQTSIVTLSSNTAKQYSASKAITIGTDIFAFANLEQIIIVVKGLNKAKSLKTGFTDPDTGLGYLLKHYSHKTTIYADYAALSDL